MGFPFDSVGTIPIGTATGPFAGGGDLDAGTQADEAFSSVGAIRMGSVGSSPFNNGFVLGVGTPAHIFAACGTLIASGLTNNGRQDEDGNTMLDEDDNIMLEE